MLKYTSLIAVMLATACNQRDTEKERFVGMFPDQRVEFIRSLPLDRQLALYLYAMRRVTPRPVALAVEIAQGGRQNAQVISRRIRRTSEIGEKNNLLMILISMREMNIFDSCRDRGIRDSILPEAYSVHQTPEHLRYALGIIDLCIREAPAASTRAGAPPTPGMRSGG